MPSQSDNNDETMVAQDNVNPVDDGANQDNTEPAQDDIEADDDGDIDDTA